MKLIGVILTALGIFGLAFGAGVLLTEIGDSDPILALLLFIGLVALSTLGARKGWREGA